MLSDMNTKITPPIQLESISKCYRIFQNPQDRFKQALLDRFHNTLGRKMVSPLYREHWALSDVSFELQPGEAVGILGRNGAGKSTLLQIIAGTLEPTSGNVKTSGRITALLELGSGFNPEFTGRENVILNGQILGLSREEILNKFDDIASFADIGDFIDQPVKTYSSGMMMRLAFSVQTALNPSILIVDEALAVGDIFFQAKCMRRLRQMRDGGTTTLFVSHAPNMVQEFCTRGILFDNGRLVADGQPNVVVHQYIDLIAKKQLVDININTSVLMSAASSGAEELPLNSIKGNNVLLPIQEKMAFMDKELFDRNANENRTGNRKAEFVNVVLVDVQGRVSNTFGFGEDVTCQMVVQINAELRNLWIGYKIRTVTGVDIIHADSSLYEQLSYPFVRGKTYLIHWRFKMGLMHGAYTLGCAIGLPDPPVGIERIMEYVDIVNVAQTFAVRAREDGMIGGTAVWDNKLKITELN